MTSLAVVEQRARLQVIEGGLSPKRGRPSAADDHRLEMAARRSEEQQMDADMAPLINWLELLARRSGPSLWRVVAEVSHVQHRHARRWAEPDDVA